MANFFHRSIYCLFVFLCHALQAAGGADVHEGKPESSNWVVSTVATGSLHRFGNGIAMDSAGNIYVPEYDLFDNSTVQILEITPAGVISALAGSSSGYADGMGTEAQFAMPSDIAVDMNENVYVLESNFQRIRKISPDGMVSTFAGSPEGDFGYVDGVGTKAKFYLPSRIAVDRHGNVYVSDGFNQRIRKITPDGTVSTLAGSEQGFADGPGKSAKFYDPGEIMVDNNNGNIYVLDGHAKLRIRKITPDGTVSTILTGGKLNKMFRVAMDRNGNFYMTDFCSVYKMTSKGAVTRIAGSDKKGYVDGVGTSARFNNLSGITVDNNGIIYAIDYLNNAIRKIVHESATAN